MVSNYSKAGGGGGGGSSTDLKIIPNTEVKPSKKRTQEVRELSVKRS
jgi:hypothetical protein